MKFEDKIQSILEGKYKEQEEKNKMDNEEEEDELDEARASLSSQLKMILSGNSFKVEGVNVSKDEAKKMLNLYKLMDDKTKKRFDDMNVSKAKQFVKNLEDKL